ncbi:MFS transporter [Ideonella alba]|uniref:MFS transporter n=1 Tax=Ideonella alba TaxID=2824118 RepID=A0A941BLC6_9BURK|nr:MFS transporter [Ideonella alba]MBQ0931054.1 MFS transporter [Ideonella alba]
MYRLRPDDLLRDPAYRRLWVSVLCGSLGGQITLLALPLSAAVLLHASPTQMGWLTALELLPFVLFSLPSGVWLDRVRKLPVYVAGELSLALAVGSVPLAWAMGWLSMNWLYGVAFVVGMVNVSAGTAAQIVLTQVVPRQRLVEAHAKNALASSGAEVVGPGLAGLLIRAVGAPLALLADAVLLTFSAGVLKGLRVTEHRDGDARRGFLHELLEGLRFVRSQALLVSLAACVATWQMCYHSALVVQILHATRTLGLDERQVGLCYIALGVGTVTASLRGDRLSRRIGPGPSLVVGFAITSMGWGAVALAPTGAWGVAAFAWMLMCFGAGAVILFINFISLRQAATPEPLLGRMTSTMRWLILLPAGPGALWGGWLGEHVGLRASLASAAIGSALLALLAWRLPAIRGARQLPTPAQAT